MQETRNNVRDKHGVDHIDSRVPRLEGADKAHYLGWMEVQMIVVDLKHRGDDCTVMFRTGAKKIVSNTT